MSIATHSQPKDDLFIISAHRASTNENHNKDQHRLMGDFLNRIKDDIDGAEVTEVKGTYMGATELSYLTKGIPEFIIHSLAMTHSQDNYLRLVNHKHGLYKAFFIPAKLGYADRALQPAGYLRSVSKQLIDELALDYTHRADTDTYYTIWPTDTTTMAEFDAEVAYARDHTVEHLKAVHG